MLNILFGLLLASFVAGTLPVVSPIAWRQPLAKHEFSLRERQTDAWVNGVFKKNILLTLAYARGVAKPGGSFNWADVEAPFRWNLTLSPGQVLAYHDTVLPKYQAKATPFVTVNFNGSEGFLSDGYLVGDGTCHLASLLSWVAKDAGLAVEAPTNHNFAEIPQVPKQEGVSIYNHPAGGFTSMQQNLYIQNNRQHAVQFVFDYDGETLRISAEELL